MAREGTWMGGAGPAGFARGIWGAEALVGNGMGRGRSRGDRARQALGLLHVQLEERRHLGHKGEELVHDSKEKKDCKGHEASERYRATKASTEAGGG